MSKDQLDLLHPDADFIRGRLCEQKRQAADALEAKAAPVAYITGQFAGRCVIEAINRAAVLPTGMALYATQQPSAGVVMPDELFDGHAVMNALSEKAKARTSAENVSDVLDAIASLIRARLNGKEVV